MSQRAMSPKPCFVGETLYSDILHDYEQVRSHRVDGERAIGHDIG